jgi:hypothetical protein
LFESVFTTPARRSRRRRRGTETGFGRAVYFKRFANWTAAAMEVKAAEDRREPLGLTPRNPGRWIVDPNIRIHLVTAGVLTGIVRIGEHEGSDRDKGSGTRDQDQRSDHVPAT